MMHSDARPDFCPPPNNHRCRLVRLAGVYSPWCIIGKLVGNARERCLPRPMSAQCQWRSVERRIESRLMGLPSRGPRRRMGAEEALELHSGGVKCSEAGPCLVDAPRPLGRPDHSGVGRDHLPRSTHVLGLADLPRILEGLDCAYACLRHRFRRIGRQELPFNSSLNSKLSPSTSAWASCGYGSNNQFRR